MEIFDVDGFGVVGIIPQEQKFHAIGTGAAHAIIAHRTLSSSKNASRYDKMRVIMTVTSDIAPGCSGPVHIGRVTSAGYQPLLSE